MVVRFPLVLEGEPTVRHVVEVLEPLKIGDGHTARVDVHVWDDEHALVLTDLKRVLTFDKIRHRTYIRKSYL
jgi:hypothetical protein